MQTPAPATTEAAKPGFTSYDEITAGCPTPQVYHHALRHIWPLSLFPTSEILPEHRTGCQQKCEPVQQALAITVLLSDGSNLLTFRCSFFRNCSHDGAVRRMRTRIGLLAQPEPMRSIIDATQ